MTWNIENRIGASGDELEIVRHCLQVAERMRDQAALPLLSNFHVGGCGYCGQGRFAKGANYERGAGPGKAIDDAIHSEDAVVSDMLTSHGPSARIEIIATVTKYNFISLACGRCRGALETYAVAGDVSKVIYCSGSANHKAVLWRLSELLPPYDSFELIELSDQSGEVQNLIELAKEASADGVQNITLPVTGPEGAAVLTSCGKFYKGSRINTAAFYGLSAIGGCMQAAHSQGERNFEALAFISDSGLILPEDRQFVFEFADIAGISATLPVYMFSAKSGTLRRTTPDRLLPWGFSLRDVYPQTF